MDDDGLMVGTPPPYMPLGSQESRRAVQWEGRVSEGAAHT